MGDEPGSRQGGQRTRWMTAAAVTAVVVGVAAWWRLTETAPTAEFSGAVAADPIGLQSPSQSAPAEPLPGLMRSQRDALDALAGFLGLASPPGNFCPGIQGQGWRCETLSAASWDDLLEFDRPVVLTLVSPARFSNYAVLVGVEGEEGILWRNQRQHRVSLAELGPLWRGDFDLLWRPPGAYAGPVSLGDRGPMVSWLARAFADLDGQAQPLTEDEFNAALEARVRLFQRQFNLRDDGVVGIKTLLRLNTVRGEAPSLQQPSEIARLGMP